MARSLRRAQAEATGLPLYPSYDAVPPGLLSRTACNQTEQPVAYVLNHHWLGYLPLYDRRSSK